MKILKVKFKNIRAYRDQTFQFHPNINAIFGDSDAGKSAFVSGLRFAIMNQYSKRIKTIGCKEESFVIISDGVSTVKRVQGKVNGYVVRTPNGTSSLEAIDKDLPEIVKETFGIHSTNIQKQSEIYFLLDKSSGQISKQLNQVSGLSEIDAVIKLSTQRVNETSALYRDTNLRIAEKKSKIQETTWVISADRELVELEVIEQKMDELSKGIHNIEYLVDSYDRTIVKIGDTLPETIVLDYSNVYTVFNELKEIDQKIFHLKELTENYAKTERFLARYTDHSEELANIESKVAEISKLDTEINFITEQVTLLKTLSTELSTVEKLEEKIQKEISKIEVCPTCKRPFED